MRRRHPTVRLAIVFAVLAAIAPSHSFAQTMTDTPEVAGLKSENKQLREKLAAAEQKIKSLSAKTTPTPTPTATPRPSTRTTETTAEAATERPMMATFLDSVFLRKSVFSEDQLSPTSISSPAQFSFQHPGHGTDSYAIDAGAAATFISSAIGQAQIDWGVGADYHRNSSASSPKNLFQSGLVADSVFGNITTSDFFVRAKASLSYKDDEQKDQEGITGGIDVLPGYPKLLLTDDPNPLGPARWRWQPFVGLRWEASTDVPTGAANGYDVLARYGLEAEIFPLYEFIGESLQGTLALIAWSDIGSSGVYKSKDWRGYLDAHLTYWFNADITRGKQKAKLGFGLGYENGNNPDTNSTNVDLLTLSLTANF